MIYDTKNGELFITKHKSHKLEGMHSMSTSAKENPFCQKMKCHPNPDCVCRSCYAWTLESMRGRMRRRYASNGEILKRKLNESDIPIFGNNVKYLRNNAFGEFLNKTHYNNFLSIAEANPQVKMAIWTKRLDIVKEGTIVDWPNVRYIYSSPIKNKQSHLPKGFHHVFTVYTLDYRRAHPEVVLNCNAACASCLNCYDDVNFVEVFVNEPIR